MLMRKSDVVVIGAGLAGLTAAIFASQQGYNVTLLAKGAGTLAFGGGTIDVLGYSGGNYRHNPLLDLAGLPPEHPYRKTGSASVAEAIHSFGKLCTEANYPLDGSPEVNTWVLTAAGTRKPSCLVPKTMNTADLEQAKNIIVVTFNGLKDFYPALIMNGLKRLPHYAGKEIQTVNIETGLAAGRDVTILDIARWFDRQQGRDSFVSQLSGQTPVNSCLLMPPVLGTQPDYEIWQQLQQRLACRMIEMAAAPPGITGMRLRTLLLRVLRQRQVAIIEQAYVRKAEVEALCCKSVITRHFGRERIYKGDAFILATGGFLGGGLLAEPRQVTETVFGLPVVNTLDAAKSEQPGLLEAGAAFQSGVAVDGNMRPVDAAGGIVLANVHLAGNILAGYDYAGEKSGNGVAVVSAYQAVKAMAGRCLA